MTPITVELPEPLLVVELDLPPRGLSANAAKGSARRARSRAVRQYRTAAGWRFYHTRGADFVDWPLSAALVRPIFYWSDRRRRDADNAAASLKPVWDGLQDAGVIRNDSGLTHLPPIFELDKTWPRLVVEVYDVEITFKRTTK